MFSSSLPVGALAEWLADHPVMLSSVLPLVLQALGNPDLSVSSVSTLKKICRECKYDLPPYASNIVAVSRVRVCLYRICFMSKLVFFLNKMITFSQYNILLLLLSSLFFTGGAEQTDSQGQSQSCLEMMQAITPMSRLTGPTLLYTTSWRIIYSQIQGQSQTFKDFIACAFGTCSNEHIQYIQMNYREYIRP